METYKRICLRDTALVAQNGDTQKLERGKEYLTSRVRDDGTVVVFSSPFWAPFDASLFGGEEKFT